MYFPPSPRGGCEFVAVAGLLGQRAGAALARRNVAIGFWLYSTLWLWFPRDGGDQPAWPHRSWYTRKCSPSFADALAAVRPPSGVNAFCPPLPPRPSSPKWPTL